MCQTKILTYINAERHPFGTIYLATNSTNGKVYVGQVILPKSIEDRWKEHLMEGKSLQRKRKRNPAKKYYDSHLNNAIAKYGEDVWKVRKIDIAYNQTQLDEKEIFWVRSYDSMDPNKGYNMKEGGKGGKLRDDLRAKISERVKEKWTEEEYREKQRKAVERLRHDPKYQAIKRRNDLKMTKFIENEEEFLKDIKRFMSVKWLVRKYKVSHPALLRNIRKILGKYGVKDCRQARRYLNREEFLRDIKRGMIARKIINKHKTNREGLKRLIKQYLGRYGITYYTEAKEFLKDKNIEEIFKEIENP